MSRKLVLLNLVLLAAAGLLGWQLRRELQSARARQQALYRYQAKPVPAIPLPPLPKSAGFDAASYADIAQNTLFSKDRNPTVVVDVVPPPPPPPVPPFPVARGVMLWQGLPPTIVLSEKAGGAQKGYHPGDLIGEWKIVSIDNKYVIFSWSGKEFQKRIDELLDKTPIEMAAAPQAAPAAAAKPAPQTNLGGNSALGVDMGGGLRACTPGDKSAPGTVLDGLKKVVSESPFGQACRWEPMK